LAPQKFCLHILSAFDDFLQIRQTFSGQGAQIFSVFQQILKNLNDFITKQVYGFRGSICVREGLYVVKISKSPYLHQIPE